LVVRRSSLGRSSSAGFVSFAKLNQNTEYADRRGGGKFLHVAGPWSSAAIAALFVLAAYLQFRVIRIRREAKKREELFQIITENAADMIALVDVKGKRLYNSPAYKRILGYSAAELGETSSFEQIHPEDRLRVLEAARAAKETGIGQGLEYRIKHKNGSWHVLESMAGTIRGDDGQVAKLVIVNRDITERKRAQAQLEHNSLHDEMTGLANRRLFLDRLQQTFLHHQRDGEKPYAVLFVDVDGFKNFNEEMGNAAGDRVILEVSNRLADCLRDDDTIAATKNSSTSAMLSRMGGDEFAVLLNNLTDPSDAMRVGKRILGSIGAPVTVNEREVKASASIGIAVSAGSYRRSEDILQDADVAMRRAKNLGGGRCELFDEAMHSRAVSRLQLEGDLRKAIAEKQFLIYYQPIVQIGTRRIVSFEALLRWQHPEQGLISPHKFLEAAEDTGLLVAIGRWMMTEACRQLCAWNAHNRPPRPIRITVNVSARQFADAGLVGMVEAALRETRMDGSQLQLELTENVAARDSRLTATVLSHFKHMGVGTILDNFGTGHCSLMALTDFPIDALKIDRSLVKEMMSDRRVLDIVELIMSIAHKMKFQTIAEGIETSKQLDCLRDLRCDLGQGFLFSPAVDGEAAEQMLRDPGVLMRPNGQSVNIVGVQGSK
jgi:diguanylate cyclase (GGDEF)-like protein/PAS domain S-box-containing protein